MTAKKKKQAKQLNKQQREVRDQKVWELRIQGFSQWQIADEMKISRRRVRQIIDAQYKKIQERNSETREAVVLIDLQRIDLLIQKLFRELHRAETGKKIKDKVTAEKHYKLKHGGRDGFTEELEMKTEVTERVRALPPEVKADIPNAIEKLIHRRHELLGTYEANKKVQEDDGPKDAKPKQYELKISLPDGTALGPIHNYNDIEAALNATTQQDPHRFEHEPDTDAS